MFESFGRRIEFMLISGESSSIDIWTSSDFFYWGLYCGIVTEKLMMVGVFVFIFISICPFCLEYFIEFSIIFIQTWNNKSLSPNILSSFYDTLNFIFFSFHFGSSTLIVLLICSATHISSVFCQLQTALAASSVDFFSLLC